MTINKKTSLLGFAATGLLTVTFGLTSGIAGAAPLTPAPVGPSGPSQSLPAKGQWPALSAVQESAAEAAATAAARQTEASGAPLVQQPLKGTGASPYRVTPDDQEPINTQYGPYYPVSGCGTYSQFGNVYSTAYGKGYTFDNGDYCGVSVQVLAYTYDDQYVYGPIESNSADIWVQSSVLGANVLSAWITTCNAESQCSTFEMDAF